MLICWQHEEIPAIASEIAGIKSPAARLKWPKDRFDLVWVFERNLKTSDLDFSTSLPATLDGDSDRPIDAIT